MFWLIAFALAWAITLPMAAHQLGFTDLRIPFAVAFLVGLAPAIAAFVAAPMDKRLGELWGNVTRFSAPAWTYLLALLLPALLLAGPFAWAYARGEPLPELGFSQQTAMFAALWFALAWGEEIGWRGYALPRMVQRHGFFVASTVLGIIWCVWHYPRILASPYITDFNAALPMIGLFSLQIILANYVICWLTARARYAVIVPVLFHTGFNVVSTIMPTASIDAAVTGVIGVLATTAILIGAKSPVMRREER